MDHSTRNSSNYSLNVEIDFSTCNVEKWVCTVHLSELVSSPLADTTAFCYCNLYVARENAIVSIGRWTILKKMASKST